MEPKEGVLAPLGGTMGICASDDYDLDPDEKAQSRKLDERLKGFVKDSSNECAICPACPARTVLTRLPGSSTQRL